jgi:hypothetical protein
MGKMTLQEIVLICVLAGYAILILRGWFYFQWEISQLKKDSKRMEDKFDIEIKDLSLNFIEMLKELKKDNKDDHAEIQKTLKDIGHKLARIEGKYDIK